MQDEDGNELDENGNPIVYPRKPITLFQRLVWVAIAVIVIAAAFQLFGG